MNVFVISIVLVFKDKKQDLIKVIQEAQKSNRGIWSLGDQRVSAAEQKRKNVESVNGS